MMRFINGQERAFLLEVLRLAETKKWVILNFRAKWENDPNAEKFRRHRKKYIWIKISVSTPGGRDILATRSR